MKTNSTFLVVDPEVGRRSRLSFLLNSDGFHAEPCATIAEFSRPLPEDGKIFAYDDGKSVGEICAALAQRGTWLPVIAYADSPSPRSVVDALRAGAVDYLPWPVDLAEVVARLGRLDDMESEFGHAQKRQLRMHKMLEKLSPREQQVLASIKDGYSNNMIAEKLSISPRTVAIHRANMLKKVGARSSFEAVRIAVEAGPYFEPRKKVAR